MNKCLVYSLTACFLTSLKRFTLACLLICYIMNIRTDIQVKIHSKNSNKRELNKSFMINKKTKLQI